jgi:hypothetical protein
LSQLRNRLRFVDRRNRHRLLFERVKL